MTPDGNIDHAATDKYTEQEHWARHEHFKRLKANKMGRRPTEFATLPDFIPGFSQTATAASKAASGASEGASAAEVPSDPESEFRALEESYEWAAPKERKELEQRMKDLKRRLR